MPHKQPADDKPLSIEQARGKIAKAMNDLVAGNYSGPISFRLKPTKKPGETYPLKLTWHQRDTRRSSESCISREESTRHEIATAMDHSLPRLERWCVCCESR